MPTTMHHKSGHVNTLCRFHRTPVQNASLQYRRMDKMLPDGVSPGRKVFHLAEQLKIKPGAIADMIGINRTSLYGYIRSVRPVNPTQAGLARLREALVREKGLLVPLEWFYNGLPGDAPTEEVDPHLGLGSEAEPASIKAVHPSTLTAKEELKLQHLDVEVPVWDAVLGNHEYEQTFEIPSRPRLKKIAMFYTAGRPVQDHVLIIVKGTSMLPRIDHSEQALVLLDPNVPADRLVVVRSPDNRNFVKVLRKVRGQLELHPLNPAYAPITDLSGWVIKGGVTMIEHHYEPGKPNIEWDQGRFLRA